jgi:hypothetical protein
VRHTPLRPLRLVPLFVLVASVDCKCIEHPLYDATANRFDTFLIGGGNSQFRPFRSAQLDPDAGFEVELTLAFEPEHATIRAWLEAGDPDAIHGVVRTEGAARELGELTPTGEDLHELRLPRALLEAELGRGDIHVELQGESGGAIVIVVDRDSYEAALDEHEGGRR